MASPAVPVRSSTPRTKQQPLTDKQKTALLGRKPYERFKADGYSITPIALFAYADRFREGGAQILAVQWIMFEQFRRDKPPAWVKVSTRALSRLTNAAYTAKAFDLALEDAATRGLVEREKRGREWWYRVFPESWGAIDPVEKTPKLLLMPEPEASEPDADEPEAVEAEAAEPDAAEPVLVASGKVSKARVMSLRIEAAGVPEPVDVGLQFRVRNDLGVPFACKPRFDGKTFLCVVSKAPQKGEEKANDCEVQFHNVSGSTQRNQRLTETALVLKGLWKDIPELASEPLDKVLVTRVADALGEAPASELANYAPKHIAAMRRKRKPILPGLMVFFATACATKWREAEADRAAAERFEAAKQTRAEHRRVAADFDVSSDSTVWPEIRAAIADEVSPIVFANWFERTRGSRVENGILYVEVPDEATATFLSEEHGALMDETAAAVSHRAIREVRIEVAL